MGTFGSEFSSTTPVKGGSSFVKMRSEIGTTRGISFLAMSRTGGSAYSTVMLEIGSTTSTCSGVDLLPMIFAVRLECGSVSFWVCLFMSALYGPDTLAICCYICACYHAVLRRVFGSFAAFIGIDTCFAARLVPITLRYSLQPQSVELAQRLPFVAGRINAYFARNVVTIFDSHATTTSPYRKAVSDGPIIR